MKKISNKQVARESKSHCGKICASVDAVRQGHERDKLQRGATEPCTTTRPSSLPRQQQVAPRRPQELPEPTWEMQGLHLCVAGLQYYEVMQTDWVCVQVGGPVVVPVKPNCPLKRPARCSPKCPAKTLAGQCQLVPVCRRLPNMPACHAAFLLENPPGCPLASMLVSAPPRQALSCSGPVRAAA